MNTTNSFLIVATEVKPVEGQNKALLTIQFGDGLEATSEISQGAALLLSQQLAAYLQRRVK